LLISIVLGKKETFQILKFFLRLSSEKFLAKRCASQKFAPIIYKNVLSENQLAAGFSLTYLFNIGFPLISTKLVWEHFGNMGRKLPPGRKI